MTSDSAFITAFFSFIHPGHIRYLGHKSLSIHRRHHLNRIAKFQHNQRKFYQIKDKLLKMIQHHPIKCPHLIGTAAMSMRYNFFYRIKRYGLDSFFFLMLMFITFEFVKKRTTKNAQSQKCRFQCLRFKQSNPYRIPEISLSSASPSSHQQSVGVIVKHDTSPKLNPIQLTPTKVEKV